MLSAPLATVSRQIPETPSGAQAGGVIARALQPAADSEQDGDQPQQADKALAGDGLQSQCAQQAGGGQRADAQTVPGQDAPLAGWAVCLRTEQGQQKQVVDIGAGIAENSGEDGIEQNGRLLSAKDFPFIQAQRGADVKPGEGQDNFDGILTGANRGFRKM